MPEVFINALPTIVNARPAPGESTKTAITSTDMSTTPMTLFSRLAGATAGGKRLQRSAKLLTALCLLVFHAEASAINCPTGTSPIDWTAPQGTRWEMCWTHEPRAGLVLRNMFYTDGDGARRLVLRDGLKPA